MKHPHFRLLKPLSDLKLIAMEEDGDWRDAVTREHILAELLEARALLRDRKGDFGRDGYKDDQEVLNHLEKWDGGES